MVTVRSESAAVFFADRLPAVEMASAGRVIGQLYLKQIEPLEHLTCELGYILSPAHQRQGFGAGVQPCGLDADAVIDITVEQNGFWIEQGA